MRLCFWIFLYDLQINAVLFEMISWNEKNLYSLLVRQIQTKTELMHWFERGFMLLKMTLTQAYTFYESVLIR